MASSATIRVLIVDDIQETRENIRRMLQFESRVEVVGSAQNGSEAISMSIELKPDVVIMDINMPDMDGISATEAIRKKVPYAQIIILSVQADPSYMRRAMLAGARDFLTKPPMSMTTARSSNPVMSHDRKIKPRLLHAAGVQGRGWERCPPERKSHVKPQAEPAGSGPLCASISRNLPILVVKVASLCIAVMLNNRSKTQIVDLHHR